MNAIDISGIVQTSVSVETILVYIGTILVGFEFVRKIDRLQVILVLVATYPLKHAINAFPTTPEQREGFKWRKAIKSISGLKTFYTIILLIPLLPLSIVSLLAFLFTTLINSIDDLLNYLWRKLNIKFKDTSKKIASLLIQRIKRYHGLQPKSVVEKMIDTKIPFIPVIGITIILISFFMYIF